ncbi:MAG TPA: hypothetical protein PL152_01435 [Steroidobacteraceae bacterium]|nr:hypothetical protein [Steroidobacteraceae bacterium]HQR47964.1 hypothetical protein [Steroidobacteraceae bacterium]
MASLALALLVTGCGHSHDDRSADSAGTAHVSGQPDVTPRPASGGETSEVARTPGAASGASMPSGQQALCIPANEGSLEARLHGAIDAEIRWAYPMPQCRGGVRPDGVGVRLLYKGEIPGQGPLLVVIGMGPLRAGENATSVPANITLVREGSGRFFATQGDDKCSVDEVQQVPVFGNGHTYRITGRGYCTQPARAVGGEGVVVVSRFDLSAVVDFQ